MKQTNKAAGIAAMSIVVFIYGISYIAREAVGVYLGTTAIVGLQMGIMALLFTIYNLVTHKSFKVKKKDLCWILVSGIFGTTFFHGFTLLGVNSIGATVSSLL